jgi:predicted nucleic acid-binding protein
VAVYLDANLIVATLLPEARSEAVFQFLLRQTEPLVVTSFTAAEVASALSRLVRMGELSSAEARLALSYFDGWRLAETMAIEIDDLDIVAAGDLVRRFELKLRAPDALHLAICYRAGARLATSDAVLADAAHSCGLVVVQP